MLKRMKEYTCSKLSESMVEEAVDLYIKVFTSEPWKETYESRQQIVDFFKNHMANNYFLGYVLLEKERLIGVSLGMRKPWNGGMEYYLDEYFIAPEEQGQGAGTWFLQEIELRIEKEGLNGIFLMTNRQYPAYSFYRNNGYFELEGMVGLGK